MKNIFFKPRTNPFRILRGNPRLKLVRGTRLTSALFIGASMAAAAGILWAANMYYDIDTGKVMVEEDQRVTGLLEATAGLRVTGGDTGIGTTTPRYLLDVWGDMGVGTSTAWNVPALYVDSGAGGRVGIGTTTLSGLLTVGTTTPRFVVDPAGNVGVATTTPSSEFAVAGNITGSGNITLYGTNVTSTFGAPIQTTRVKITEGATAADLYLKTTDALGNTTWASIPTGVWSENGNYIYPTAISRWVGIATTTPRWRLDVAASAGFGTTTDYNTPVLLVDSLTKRVGIATSTPSAQLAVNGDVMIDGDLKFVGDQFIQGSGTLTINPTSNLYFFSTSYGINSTGNLTVATATTPVLTYNGDITIAANSASNNTTVTVTNQDGSYVANLVVEGTVEAAGVTTTDTLYVTANGAKITGTVTVTGDVVPATTANYDLGSSSLWWRNLYVSTTTIGSAASSLVIDVDDIRAPGGLTITAQAGKITLATGTEVVLSGTGLFEVGSAGQFYIDASGNVTTTGSIYAEGGIKTGTGGGYTVGAAGSQIVRGVDSIFGFDLPVRCNTACTSPNWATTTRTIANTNFFPPAYDGTTRKYRFSITYSSASSTATYTWQIATTSENSSYQFTLPATGSTDITKAFTTTTDTITSLPPNDWFLRARVSPNGGYDFQVYQILLVGIDEVD